MVGTALMPNLSLKMGENHVQASSVFAANGSPQGLQTLNDFVGKKDVQLSIAGFDGSTGVVSLVNAFETLNIDVTLPALKTDLLNTATLQGEPLMNALGILVIDRSCLQSFRLLDEVTISLMSL